MVTVIVGVVTVLVAVMLGSYVVALYNGLVEVRNNIGKAWNNIDVLLQQRHDELPKLIDATEGYLAHERELLQRITRLRVEYAKASSIDDKARIENDLDRALGRLRVAVEAYPELKSSPLFAQVLARISALESSVADRRELFNDSVNVYNVRIARFPELLLARALGYGRYGFLEVPEERTQDPSARFAPVPA